MVRSLGVPIFRIITVTDVTSVCVEVLLPIQPNGVMANASVYLTRQA